MRRPPITRSYSRPSSLRTLSIAACMRRRFSGFVQSIIGSFVNCSGGLMTMRVSSARLASRAGWVRVAISASFQFRSEDAFVAGTSGLLLASVYPQLDALSWFGTPEPPHPPAKAVFYTGQRHVGWPGRPSKIFPRPGRFSPPLNVEVIQKRASDYSPKGRNHVYRLKGEERWQMLSCTPN